MHGPLPTDERRHPRSTDGDRPVWLRSRPRPKTYGFRHEGLIERRSVPREEVAFPGEYEQDALPKRMVDRERIYRRSLILADLVAGISALTLSLVVIGEDRVGSLSLVIVLPLLVLLSKLHGLYDRDDLLLRKTTVEEVPRLFQHATVATLAVVVFDSQLQIGDVGDAQALTLCALLLTLTTVTRMLARRLAGHVAQAERVLVLGDEHEWADLRERTAGRIHVDFVGAVPLASITSQKMLRDTVKRMDVDRVVISPVHTASASATPELIRAAKAAGVHVSVLPGVLDVVGSQVEQDDVFGVTLLGVRRFGLTRSSRAIKRSFDIAVGGTLLLLALPVILGAAVMVRIETRGPGFFRQERIGYRGRRFRMVKLRTMVDGADELKADMQHLNEAGDGLFKVAEDPRVTRTGRLLRRAHIDELPQLLNVVRGEMSLVGPRPLVPDEDARITGLDRRRLELTPGMTGPWQILGTHRRVPMAEMVKLDYLYAVDWSLWNDVKILVRTAAQVANRSGV